MTKAAITFDPNSATLIRSVTSSPSADSTTITDSAFPPTNAATPQGYKSVLLYPRLTGGTAPSVKIQVLHRVSQALVGGGSGWVEGTTTVSLSDGEAAWVEVMGRDFYPRLADVSGSPTQVDVYAAGWESYRYDGPRAS